MASLLYRLGLGAFRHRLLVLLIWLVALVGVGVGAATLAGPLSSTVTIPGLESTNALNVVSTRFGTMSDAGTAQVIVEVPKGEKVTDAGNVSRLNSLVNKLDDLPGVATATDPLSKTAPTISADLRAAYSTVTYHADATKLTTDEQNALLDAVKDARASGFDVQVSGTASVIAASSATELIGVVVALVILAFTFGSMLLAGMNLLASLIGVGIGTLGITTLSGFVTLSSTTSALALMLGLAVGIDYALFIITRFRQELMRGRDVGDAIATTVGTAGSAVVTAGGTVVIALAGLCVVGIPFLAEMGLAAAGTVVIAVLVATTLVPAVLGWVGYRALPRKARRDLGSGTVFNSDPAPAAPRGLFAGWSRMVTKRRWPVLIGAVVALAVISLPVLSLRTTLLSAPDHGSTQAKAQAISDTHFGEGVSGPLLILVDGDGFAAKATTISKQVVDLKDVAVVSAPVVDKGNDAALITVIPKSGPLSVSTENLVHSIRDTFQSETGAKVSVTGSTAVSVDVAAKLSQALPLYIALVVGLALILLIIVFRSILVPVTAVVGFLLTLGAGFGAATAVFEWGWLADLFGVTKGPINSAAPIIVVGVLFGLAMDYQVFMVSRIHEATSHGLKPMDAVAHGFRQAAPVVTAAALIMFGVFAGFFPGGGSTIKPIAFILAFGVLVDAFVVRMMIIPAILSVLGRVAWSLPKWLRWLPELDVEGVKLEERRQPRTESPVLTDA